MPGVSRVFVSVNITDDLQPEQSESFACILSGVDSKVSSQVLLEPSEITVTIIDNEN